MFFGAFIFYLNSLCSNKSGNNLNASPGLFSCWDNLVFRQIESPVSSVTQLDGVSVLDSTFTLSPVIRTTCSSIYSISRGANFIMGSMHSSKGIYSIGGQVVL
ncbi:unnamed protein product, partial [Meganyctiphanes norvegica]